MLCVVYMFWSTFLDNIVLFFFFLSSSLISGNDYPSPCAFEVQPCIDSWPLDLVTTAPAWARWAATTVCPAEAELLRVTTAWHGDVRKLKKKTPVVPACYLHMLSYSWTFQRDDLALRLRLPLHIIQYVSSVAVWTGGRQSSCLFALTFNSDCTV